MSWRCVESERRAIRYWWRRRIGKDLELPPSVCRERTERTRMGCSMCRLAPDQRTGRVWIQGHVGEVLGSAIGQGSVDIALAQGGRQLVQMVSRGSCCRYCRWRRLDPIIRHSHVPRARGNEGTYKGDQLPGMAPDPPLATRLGRRSRCDQLLVSPCARPVKARDDSRGRTRRRSLFALLPSTGTHSLLGIERLYRAILVPRTSGRRTRD